MREHPPSTQRLWPHFSWAQHEQLTSALGLSEQCKVVYCCSLARRPHSIPDRKKNSAKLQGQAPAGDKPAEAKAEPFTRGEGLPVLPAKVVAKILRGEYVNMADLLQDNIALDNKLATVYSEGVSTGHLKSNKKRELTEDVHSLLSWIECFNIYSSVLQMKYPSLAKPLAAYTTMMVKEARRFGFRGWLQYDQLFRQHTTKDPTSADWARLNSALYAIYFLTRQKGKTQTCPNCMSSDHPPIHCALARREENSSSNSPGQQRDYTGGPHDYTGRRFQRPLLPRPPLKRPNPANRICYSWNDGRCARPTGTCAYRHACIRCGDDHKVVDCTHKPQNN